MTPKQAEPITVTDLLEIEALGGPEALLDLMAELILDPVAVLNRWCHDGAVLAPHDSQEGTT
jgi:hypothetical protein